MFQPETSTDGCELLSKPDKNSRCARHSKLDGPRSPCNVAATGRLTPWDAFRLRDQRIANRSAQNCRLKRPRILKALRFLSSNLFNSLNDRVPWKVFFINLVIICLSVNVGVLIPSTNGSESINW
jgi:hypothetical protein